MAKKTSKKTTPKQRLATKQASADRNRGYRRGRPVRSVQMRLPIDLVEWLDDRAREVHLNRTQFLVMMLDGAKKFGGAVEQSGLFDEMNNQVQDAVIRALEEMPRPDLERLLARRK